MVKNKNSFIHISNYQCFYKTVLNENRNKIMELSTIYEKLTTYCLIGPSYLHVPGKTTRTPETRWQPPLDITGVPEIRCTRLPTEHNPWPQPGINRVLETRFNLSGNRDNKMFTMIQVIMISFQQGRLNQNWEVLITWLRI